ncbi:MAG: 3,4-dihydroxy-2-butanone-4-phosphate synthase [Hyphomicrobiaceae bacterium]|nr:3,4-dihydroxy-2-butanone-4-phosphate synthase [Hyphomicrobiaceae bacterium]
MTLQNTPAVQDFVCGAIAPTAEIVEELRNGRMIILVDAEDRENEGDLIVPAQMATPDAINFMARFGRGLICLTLTEQRAGELRLEAMVRSNASRTGTAFTVSIEAREGITTGISAADRARTVAAAIDPSKGHEAIVSPGHVFPLVARNGGVLIRAGHTEASIDLVRMAGLSPAAVICEIMNDDGTMARLPDLVTFAQKHGLKIGTIADLIAYRLRNDRLVREVAATTVTSGYGGAFALKVFETTTVDPAEHLALVKGDISGPEPVLVRVHAVNPLADLLAAGGAGSEIGSAMAAIAHEGRGVMVLIRDLRPKAVSDAVGRASSKDTGHGTGHGGSDPAARRQVEIGVGAQILRELGVRDMVLLTNSPAHVYVGLEGFGLRIVGTRAIPKTTA